MVKRVYAIVTAAFFLFAALPALADAAQPSFQQKLLKRSITGLQQKIFTEDDSALSAVSIQFLDDVLAAGLANNKADLQLAVARYAADVQEIQAIDNATKCAISPTISITMAVVGMVTEVASGNAAACIAINLSNSVADIMAAQTKYQICLIDDAGGSGDRDALVQKLKGIETYDFITNAMEVFMCIEAPSAGDYISLFFNLIGIFTAGK
jgi:hypothetical protein